MKLPEVSVRRPVMTMMFFLALYILGVMSFYLLPIDVMPDLEVPSITVITQYPGAGAEDVEEMVTKPLENNLATVTNLDEIRSTSIEEYSVINLKFTWGTNMDSALVDCRDKVAFLGPYLPSDVEDSVFLRLDMTMFPVIIYGVTAGESYPQLYDILNDQVSPILKRRPGVALTQVLGAPSREIRVSLDPNRLAAHNLSTQKIVQAIRYENVTFPAGDIKFGKTDYSLRVPGEFQNLDELKHVVVDIKNGVPIYLKDVAAVEDTFKELDRVLRMNKTTGTMLIIQKASGSNTVQVVKEVKKGMEEVKRLVPPDVRFVELMDSSEFIQRSIDNLYEVVVYACIFVILVVLVFLRNIRATFIIALSIPFSLIVSFIFLYVMGYTINTMSVSSLAIAIGLVVDDTIVVLENIFRHRLKGVPPRRAAVFAASEVGLAVSASTFTIIAIILPVLFVPGITGVMFKQFGLVTSLVIGISLLVSLTLTPMLASQLFKKPLDAAARPRNILEKGFHYTEQWLNRLEEKYSDLLAWALSRKKIILLGGAGIFLLSLLTIPFLGTEFFPQIDQGQVSGVVELPSGTRIEDTAKVIDEMEQIIQEKVPESRMVFVRAGESETGFGLAFGQREAVNIISFGIRLSPKKERSRSQYDVSHDLSREFRKIPGVETVDLTPHDPFAEMFAGGVKPIRIEIYGHDLEEDYEAARKVQKILEQTPGTGDVTISLQMGNPELWVQVDRAKASRLGLQFGLIGDTIRTSFYGVIASRYREGGKEYNIFVNLEPEYRQKLEDLGNLRIPVGTSISLPVSIPGLESGSVPLKNLAQIVPATGPLSIERKNQERVIKVESALYQRPLNDVINDIKKPLSLVPIPAGVNLVIAGYAQEQQESFRILAIVFVLGLLLVYMVMAGQFESLMHPFVIIFSVPFAITGVVWGHYLFGKNFGLISFVGLIMLIGIVVKNAIVLIDYTNILRSRGMDIESAIKEAGKIRLRPVLMTSLTAILAMIPLIVAGGEGAEIWAPMGVSVACGLTVSLIITLVFVPTMYSVLERKTELKGYEERVTGIAFKEEEQQEEE